MNGGPSIYSLSTEDRSEMREALTSLVSVSRRGEGAVTNRLMILSALSARSSVEFREKISKLPVTILDQPHTEMGIGGWLRRYSIGGASRGIRFIASDSLHASESTMQPSPENDENFQSLRNFSSFGTDLLDEQSVRHAKVQPFGDLSHFSSPTSDARVESSSGALTVPSHESSSCSATYNGTYYEGVCATQQEIDDGMAVIAALDVEAEADSIELDNACPGITPQSVQCPYFLEASASVANERSASIGTVGFFAASFSDATPDSFINGEIDCTSSNIGPRAEGADCTQSAIDAAVGVVGWGLAKYGAWAVLTSTAAPPAGAVAAAVAGTIIAAWSLGSGVSSYLACRATF